MEPHQKALRAMYLVAAQQMDMLKITVVREKIYRQAIFGLMAQRKSMRLNRPYSISVCGPHSVNCVARIDVPSRCSPSNAFLSLFPWYVLWLDYSANVVCSAFGCSYQIPNPFRASSAASSFSTLFRRFLYWTCIFCKAVSEMYG